MARAPQSGSAGGHLTRGGRGPLMHEEFVSLSPSPLPSLLWFRRERGVVLTPPWAQRRVWGLRVVLRRAGHREAHFVLPCNSHPREPSLGGPGNTRIKSEPGRSHWPGGESPTQGEIPGHQIL